MTTQFKNKMIFFIFMCFSLFIVWCSLFLCGVPFFCVVFPFFVWCSLFCVVFLFFVWCSLFFVCNSIYPCKAKGDLHEIRRIKNDWPETKARQIQLYAEKRDLKAFYVTVNEVYDRLAPGPCQYETKMAHRQGSDKRALARASHGSLDGFHGSLVTRGRWSSYRPTGAAANHDRAGLVQKKSSKPSNKPV